ncbi:MAG TPA: lipid A-modifier LpxR family protein [Thermoanaerobaculia bacterium]|nr:lipid A-modifier LpxR family protein [Thermoanaerobaculia bacterium]
MLKSLLLGLALVAFPLTAQQQPEDPPLELEFPEGKFTAFSFFVENDLVQAGGRNEDRNYTGGFGFQFNGRFIRMAHLTAPLDASDGLTRFSKKKHEVRERHYHSLLVFGTGFTPDNLNTEEPVLDDRPYASLVGIAVRRLSVSNASFDHAWSSEFAVAMLGLGVAESVQTTLHRRLRARSGLEVPYDPLGWENQISDGGELTALYRIGYEAHLAGAKPGTPERRHFQLTGGFGASAGYYTNANLLLNARLGWFDTEFWEFTPNAMSLGNQVARSDRRSNWELFAFAGVRPRLNIYNALLQGQFAASVHTVDPKPVTLEWDLGVALYVPRIRTQVTWNAFAGRTPEFEGGTPRTHTWGSIIVTFVARGKQDDDREQ